MERLMACFGCSLPGHPHDDVHWVWVPDDLPQEIWILKHRIQLPLSRIRSSVGHTYKRMDPTLHRVQSRKNHPGQPRNVRRLTSLNSNTAKYSVVHSL